MRPCLIALLSLLMSSILPESSHSEVIVYDTVVLQGKRDQIMAETRGRLFRRGGQIVEFYLDGRSIGHTLSGGDGRAFKSFIPHKAGLIKVKALSGGEEANGLILSLKKGTEIVFIEIEGCLLEDQIFKRPRKGSHGAVKSIKRKFPVVLLSMSDIKAIRVWLKEHDFIDMPVISWEGGDIFRRINEKGLRIKAVVGTTDVINSARQYRPRFFSFEEVEGSEKVDEWQEIEKRLR